MGGDKNYHLVIFISIFNREKNLLCIFYQLFEHVEILYSKNFSGYFTQPTAFTINTHLYFDKINVLQVCILTVESYSMGYLEMIVRRSGIIVVIICQTINGAEIVSPVAMSISNNSMATIPSVMNKKGVRLSGCFIPDVCNSKVNRIRVRGERYESGHAIRRRDVPLQIPSSHYLLSVLFVNYCCKQFFRVQLWRLQI